MSLPQNPHSANKPVNPNAPNNVPPNVTSNSGGKKTPPPSDVKTKATIFSRLSKQKKAGSKLPMPVIIAAILLPLLLVALVVGYFLTKPAPVKKVTTTTTTTAISNGQSGPASSPANMGGGGAYLLQIQPDHWAKAPDPIAELVGRAVKEQFTTSSFSKPDGIHLVNGAVIVLNSPTYLNLAQQVTAGTRARVENRVQEKLGPNNTMIVYTRDPVKNIFVPVEDLAQLSAIEQSTKSDAALEFNNALLMVPAPPASAPAPVVVKPAESVITQAEKNRYLSLIEKEKQENIRLQGEKQRLTQQVQEQRQSVATVLQKLEDSPTANTRLKASMLPKSTGLSVQAVVGDRVWLKDKSGKLTTLNVGDVLPDSQLRISNIDENTGVVMVTPK